MYQLPKLLTAQVLIYLRKSRTDDPGLTAEEVLSKHEQMLDDWQLRNLPETGSIPEENRYREVVSGETIDSRPKMQELLRRIESPSVRAVLVVEPQRLSRGDLEDIGRLVKIFRYTNTLIITLQYAYDMHDDHDRDAFERELKRGNDFLEYQKRIMSNGRVLSVKNGNFIGNVPPYGYRKIRIKEGKRYAYMLEPDPIEAPILKAIFSWYADGIGTTQICDRLNAVGAKPRKAKVWSPYTIISFFDNLHYIGKVYWERRATVRTVEDGEIVLSRPRSEDFLVFDGKHEPLIDQDLWERVQSIKGSHPRVRKQREFINPYAGLLRCKNCGRALKLQTYVNGVPRLVCHNQRNCKTASCTDAEMREAVVQILMNNIRKFEEQLKSGKQDDADTYKDITTNLKQQLERLYELEAAQWAEKAKGEMPDRVFERLNNDVLNEIEKTKKALAQAEMNAPPKHDIQERIITFNATLDCLLNDAAPAREKNMMLKSCFLRLTYDRKRKAAKYGNRGGEPNPIQIDAELRV